MKKLAVAQQVDANGVLRRQVRPGFTPPTTANCDPTYELEELLVESNPLHKKKKRMNSGSKRSRKGSTTKKSNVYLTQVSSLENFPNFLRFSPKNQCLEI